MTELLPAEDRQPQADATRRRGGRASWLGRTLAVAGGMRSDLVDVFPGERRHFVQMALLLLVSAVGAFLSGALALNLVSSVNEPPALWVLLLGGLAWGAVVFVINRMIVLIMDGRRGLRALTPALVGVFLSTVLGLVMSTPLMLQVFQSEVEAKVASINQERANEGLEVLKPYEEAVRQATEEVDKRRQALRDAQSGYSIEEDAGYKAATEAWQQASAECTLLQSKAERELRGELPPSEGGSGKPGASPVYQTWREQADQACRFADDKAKDVDAAKAAAQPTPEQIAARVKGAEDAVAMAEDELDRTIQTRDEAAARLAQGAEGSGLLVRIEALDALQRDTAAGALTQFALTALLASIEILPILYKLLLQWDAAPTAYERVSRTLAGADEGATATDQENPDV